MRQIRLDSKDNEFTIYPKRLNYHINSKPFNTYKMINLTYSSILRLNSILSGYAYNSYSTVWSDNSFSTYHQLEL